MLSEELVRAVVRILNAEGNTVGTGFVVDQDGLIVTTAHNTRSAGVKPGELTQVAFSTGEKAMAKVEPVWYSDTENVAILQLNNPLPNGFITLRLGSSWDVVHHSFTTFGYDPNPEFGKGKIMGRFTLRGSFAFQLSVEDWGVYSRGAPILDDIRGLVIGMVDSLYIAGEGGGRWGGVTFGIPSETLSSICPKLGILELLPNGKSKISILFLAADPTDASRLRLGEEFREIQEQLRLANLREKFTLELPQLSVRPTDISQALLDLRPQIVQFSGHGTSEGTLYFEDQTGKTHPIQPDALAALFEQFTTEIKCILLNACYSETQAKAIAKHIEYVIGMNQAIGDKAAIAFSIGFYQALGAGRTIEDAYKLGCVQIRLQGIPEHLTPVLIKKETIQS